ncbi:UNVERIFIED_CONTAM: hypothetical protein Slati_2202200 [Sesamum latifolium]|uniref:Uncharacterized protein n=1 Tax=Sesamum latifolium TaxID=2727402 RepID=A0AAW2WXG7_9LAMI
MTDQNSLQNRVAELESQVQRMMELLGQPHESPLVVLFPLVDTLRSRVETLQKTVGEWLEMVDKRVTLVVEEVSILTYAVDLKLDSMKSKLNLLKRVVGWEEDSAPVSKVKTESRCQDVKDLPSVIATTDRLVDFQLPSSSNPEKKKKDSRKDKKKSGKGTNLQDSVRFAEKKDSLMSEMQVKNGLKHGEQTYLAALIEIKSDVVQEVSNEVAELFEEFMEVFPPELPKKLLSRQAIDHAIELEPGVQAPA